MGVGEGARRVYGLFPQLSQNVPERGRDHQPPEQRAKEGGEGEAGLP